MSYPLHPSYLLLKLLFPRLLLKIYNYFINL
nr:MAG TPA: hypothetical protein [Caudoviricetes sp.]